jgi:hypothetical protein
MPQPAAATVNDGSANGGSGMNVAEVLVRFAQLQGQARPVAGQATAGADFAAVLTSLRTGEEVPPNTATGASPARTGATSDALRGLLEATVLLPAALRRTGIDPTPAAAPAPDAAVTASPATGCRCESH